MTIDNEQLKSLCEILATYNTHKQIDSYLKNVGIINLGMPTKTTAFGYIAGDGKAEKLRKSLQNEYNKSGYQRIFQYIEKVVSPVQFTSKEKRDKYCALIEDLNKVLLFIGCSINKSGKIYKVEVAKTLDEVDERVNHLKKELQNRKIHFEVMKYCGADYLRNDYFDAINEAVKSTFDRVRKITGLTTDGCELLNLAFSKNTPYIYFNKLQTSSDWNEHNGLKEMMQALYHLVRNPLSHTPKINWHIQEEKALDILTTVSLVHKYLDECYKHPLAPN